MINSAEITLTFIVFYNNNDESSHTNFFLESWEKVEWPMMGIQLITMGCSIGNWPLPLLTCIFPIPNPTNKNKTKPTKFLSLYIIYHFPYLVIHFWSASQITLLSHNSCRKNVIISTGLPLLTQILMYLPQKYD